MVIYSVSTPALPFAIAATALDGCLLLIALRLILSKVPGAKTRQLCAALEPITDAVPERIAARLSGWTGRAVPPCVSWGALILGIMAAQHLLVQIAVSVSGYPRP